MKNGLKEIGFAAFLLLLAVLLVLSLFWALSIGTVKLPLEEIYAAVLDQFTSGLPIEATGHCRKEVSRESEAFPRRKAKALIGGSHSRAEAALGAGLRARGTPAARTGGRAP